MENLLLAISSGHHAKRQQHSRSQHVVFGVLTLDLFDLRTKDEKRVVDASGEFTLPFPRYPYWQQHTEMW